MHRGQACGEMEETRRSQACTRPSSGGPFHSRMRSVPFLVRFLGCDGPCTAFLRRMTRSNPPVRVAAVLVRRRHASEALPRVSIRASPLSSRPEIAKPCSN